MGVQREERKKKKRSAAGYRGSGSEAKPRNRKEEAARFVRPAGNWHDRLVVLASSVADC